MLFLGLAKNDGMGKETNNCGAGEGPQIIYNVAGMYQFTSEWLLWYLKVGCDVAFLCYCYFFLFMRELVSLKI